MQSGSKERDGPSQAQLPSIVHALLRSYRSDERAKRIGRRFLPSHEEIVEILHLFFELLFPGYFGRLDLNEENLEYHTGNLLAELKEKLERQVERCLCFREECEPDFDASACRLKARQITQAILEKIPEIRRKLILDAQAALDGDPAAESLDEVILAYPGYRAVVVYRIAHEIFSLGVPLMPRIMSEWAHTETGADIHPAAVIGESFFIDHATGVVIGATAHIGNRVRIYQGVTLGALSLERDASGRVVGGPKRHPTVEDDVTIYAGATVLGGQTVLGRGAVIGGSTFITRSVPPGARVAIDPPKLRIGGVEGTVVNQEGGNHPTSSSLVASEEMPGRGNNK
ncbi:MAG: serine acetyltransferase [Sandaracinaceae bacterium]|nr:serine acetyltransferase [Sandaracinaceae bacterium]MDW8246864.1 serine acetyltransferase [Sandaracinaceae bacterium]